MTPYRRRGHRFFTRTAAPLEWSANAAFFVRYLAPLWINVALLCAFLPRLAFSQPARQRTPHIRSMHLHVQLFPTKHLMETTAEIALYWPIHQRALSLSFSQMAVVLAISAQAPNGAWSPLPYNRELETITLLRSSRSPPSSAHAQIRIRYQITFYSQKNHLFRQIFCQIDPGDTYFLYGWYPSLSAFADPIRGELLAGDRFPYTLTIDAPKEELPLSTGRLLEQLPLPNGRTRRRYGASPIKEAALMLVAGNYQVVRERLRGLSVRGLPWFQADRLLAKRQERKIPDTLVSFYLRPEEPRAKLQEIAQLVAKGSAYFEALWGEPWDRFGDTSSATHAQPPIVRPFATHAQPPIVRPFATPARPPTGRPAIMRSETPVAPPAALRTTHIGRWRRWRVITFGGAGARGYPMTLLLERRLHFLDGSLDRPMDALFTRRQVLLHEIAHTWWGNAVTGIQAGSAWVNEGLANYASLKALGFLYGKPTMYAALRRHLDSFLQSKWPSDLMGPGGMDQMIQRTAYTKGTLVFFSLEWMLGEKVFLEGLRLFFQLYRGGFATAKDLRRVLERHSGRSLRAFFQSSVRGDGLPWVRLLRWKASGKPPNRQLTLVVENLGDATGWLPVLIQGRSLRLLRGLTIPTGRHTLRLPLPFHPRKVRLDPHQSALQGIRPAFLLERANHARKAEQWAIAEQYFQMLLRHFPKHGHAHYSYALLLSARHRTQEALRHLQQAARLSPTPHTPSWIGPWARFRIAQIAAQQGRPDLARRLLLKLQRQRRDPYHLQEEIHQLLRSLSEKIAPPRTRP
ncbi:hypothetical protein L6R29_00165 [Myxococcota bacterium]|nr:hypothetical protein [Myxococcota bacterium]